MASCSHLFTILIVNSLCISFRKSARGVDLCTKFSLFSWDKNMKIQSEHQPKCPIFKADSTKKMVTNSESKVELNQSVKVTTQRTLTESCNIMKRLSLIALAFAAPLAVMADTVFSDTFGSGSTLNGTPTAPTATTAAYQNWTQGATPASYTIASGALHFAARNTASAFSEVQAQFASTPVTLATTGDYLDLVLVFTDTSHVLLSAQSASAQLDIGLYNSSGVLPLKGGRFDTATTATDGAAGYVGYIGRLFLNGNANVITRPAQSAGVANTNQDLLFNAAGSGAFKDPTGTQIGTTTATGFTTGLTQGSQYTIDYKLMLSASGLAITESLYDVNNTLLASQTDIANGATLVTSTIDSLAFGWRHTGATSEASSLDINSILVTDLIQQVPEPGSAVLFCGCLGLLAVVRRFRR
jgi:hypothetical protein